MERARPPTKIELLGAPGSPRVASAGERPLRVGSLPECEFRIPGDPPSVAALIVRVENRWFVAEAAAGDLQVNGTRVFQAPLSDGDCISVGGVALTIRLNSTSMNGQTKTT